MEPDQLIADATESVSDGDTMSPAERAYFESRGEKTDGLLGTDGGGDAATDATQQRRGTDHGTDAGSHADDARGDVTDDDPVDGEVDIDANGVPRDPKTGRYVPKSAFLRVKGEARSTSERLAQVTEHLIRSREREAVLRELGGIDATAPQKPAEKEESAPDPDADIFGYVKWLQQKYERDIGALKSQVETTTSETRANAQAQQMRETATRDMRAYAAQEPAFFDAYNYLVQQRDKELEVAGFADARARAEQITLEARQIVADALKGGGSAAEKIFRLAQVRGFQPKAKDAGAGKIDPAVQEQIERINKGQQAAASLRGAGTTGAAGEQLTATKVAAMGDEEYSSTRKAYIAKHGAAAWNKLLGYGA